MRLRVSRRNLAALEHGRATAESAVRAAGEEMGRLRETLDAVPMPVWRRDRGGSLVDCNLAYAASLGAAREEVLAEARELIPAGSGDAVGGPANMVRLAGSRSEQAHVVIGGQRRLLDLVEAPCVAGGTIGFARDCTISKPCELSYGATSTRMPMYSKVSTPQSPSLAPTES